MARSGSTAVGTAAGGACVGKAALFATFYGARDDPALAALHELLCRGLTRKPVDAVVDRDCPCPDKGVWVRWFDPPDRPEAGAVQVGLNAPGLSADACAAAHHRLIEHVDRRLLSALWGYTLVYEAELVDGADPAAGLEELLPAARRLDGSPIPAPLAKTHLKGGWIWLLDVPISASNKDHGTVYAALSHKVDEPVSLNAVLYGEKAPFLIPDLLAHEGYVEVRELRGEELGHRYEQRVEWLQSETNRLLGDLDAGLVARADVEPLARAHRQLARVEPALTQLRFALIPILKNYDRAVEKIGRNSVLDFHRDHLDVAITEIHLLAERAHATMRAIESVLTAIQIEVDRKETATRERQEKDEADRQTRIQVLLAVIAVAVSVPQLIDPDTAAQLVHLVRLPEPTGEDRLIILLGVRVAIGVLLTVVVALLVWWWARPSAETDAASRPGIAGSGDQPVELLVPDVAPDGIGDQVAD